MLTRFALALACTVSAIPAQAQEFRQFFAETSTPIDEITATLEPGLPDTAALTDAGDTVFLSYTGTQTPPILGSFLSNAFERLDQAVIAPGQTVSLNLHMTGDATGTQLALMVSGQFAPSDAALVDGGMVLMDGTGPGTCTGQIIIQHDTPPDQLTLDYVSAFENRGFVFEETRLGATSFFFGQAPDCTVALYFQGEAGGTTTVIRYLEE